MVDELPSYFFFGGPGGFRFAPVASSFASCKVACLADSPCAQATWWGSNPNKGQACALYQGKLKHTNISRPGVDAAVKCPHGSTVAATCPVFLPPKQASAASAAAAAAAAAAADHATATATNADVPPPMPMGPLGPRDPTGKEAGGYFSRLVAWYTKRGFTDELGKHWPSPHNYSWKHWEIRTSIHSLSSISSSLRNGINDSWRYAVSLVWISAVNEIDYGFWARYGHNVSNIKRAYTMTYVSDIDID